MHQLTTPREDQPLSTAVDSVRDAALLAEVVELRAKNEQLEQTLVSRAVSQHCNVKLRDVAAALVATTKDQELPEAIRREWRRALRRLHALERR
ncbi:hypothetical protein ABZY05_07470 [Streptomyces canus]|uniref:hypothetical protein n=1 Tax=Streptomyces canus TaxID=58343 RepID=UPI0033A42399